MRVKKFTKAHCRENIFLSIIFMSPGRFKRPFNKKFCSSKWILCLYSYIWSTFFGPG